MANCRACGGVLGIDCYNEQDCLQISYSNNYNFQYLEHYISILEYKLIQNKLSLPSVEIIEYPLVLKQYQTCEDNHCYLPF